MTTVITACIALALGFYAGAETALRMRARADALEAQQRARQEAAAEALAEAETTLLEDLYQQPAYGDDPC